MEQNLVSDTNAQVSTQLLKDLKFKPLCNSLREQLYQELKRIEEDFDLVRVYEEVVRLSIDIRTSPSPVQGQNLPEFFRHYLWDLYPNLESLLYEEDDDVTLPSTKCIMIPAINCLRCVLETSDLTLRDTAVRSSLDLAQYFSDNGFPERSFVLASLALRATEESSDKIAIATSLIQGAKQDLISVAHQTFEEARQEPDGHPKNNLIANVLDKLLESVSLHMSFDWDEIAPFLQPDTINAHPEKCAALLMGTHPENPSNHQWFMNTVDHVIYRLNEEDNEDARWWIGHLRNKFFPNKPLTNPPAPPAPDM